MNAYACAQFLFLFQNFRKFYVSSEGALIFARFRVLLLQTLTGFSVFCLPRKMQIFVNAQYYFGLYVHGLNRATGGEKYTKNPVCVNVYVKFKKLSTYSSTCAILIKKKKIYYAVHRNLFFYSTLPFACPFTGTFLLYKLVKKPRASSKWQYIFIFRNTSDKYMVIKYARDILRMRTQGTHYLSFK